MKKLLLILVSVSLLTGAAIAQPNHFGYMSVADKGLGGSYVAYPKGASSFVTNPALLHRLGWHLNIATITMGIGGSATDVINFVSDNQEGLQDFESLDQEGQSKIYNDMESFDDQWVPITFNPFVGITFPGFGVAAFGDLNTGLKLDRGIVLPAIGLKGYTDAGAAVGIGKKFFGFDLGVAGRFYVRQFAEPVRISANDAGSMGDVFSEMLDSLENTKTGFGVDVGIIRTMMGMDVGASITDLVGSRDGIVKPDLTAGAVYTLPFKNLLIRRWAVMGDFNDILNSEGTAMFQRLDFGTEVKLGFLPVDIRGGLHSGYPTMGLGVHLLIAHLDYAYFTREAGRKPGQTPETSHQVGLTIGW